MGAFSPYASVDRLESLPLQTTFRGQTSPVVQATAGAGALFASGAGAPTAAALAAAALTLPDGRLNVGTHLPLLARRYRYLGPLGEGASAQVVLAEDTLCPGHHVVIKVMRRQHGAIGAREARALRFLHSRRAGGAPAPGVVRLRGAFALGAHLCLVLERLHPRLLDWVAESAAEPPRAALPALRKLAVQALGAVAFAHAHGLVHGDIKPDNLLLRRPPGYPSMAAALVDLGGAFSATEADAVAVAGAEVGTLPYRAPEVALGLPCGPLVDEWAVGVVLAEAALKRPLFPATSPVELLAAQAGQLGPLPAAMVSASEMSSTYNLWSLVMPPPAEARQAGGRVPAETLAALLGDATGAVEEPVAPAPLPQALRALDPALAELVLGLLRFDPATRTPAAAALAHPFFADLAPVQAMSVGRSAAAEFNAERHPSAGVPRAERAGAAGAAAVPTAPAPWEAASAVCGDDAGEKDDDEEEKATRVVAAPSKSRSRSVTAEQGSAGGESKRPRRGDGPKPWWMV